MNNLGDFYKNKRVLVTGHTGFKGTWMVGMLRKLNAMVSGYSLPLSPFAFYKEVDSDIFSHTEGDIADIRLLREIFERFQPEIVFHLASHSSLDKSDKIPEYIFRTNLMGVLNVLECSRLCKSVKCVVIVTSDKCYLNRETDEPYTEKEPLGATDPYGTSKVCQELLTTSYMETFFKKDNICSATVRASNVIGPGDYNITRLVPYLLEALGKGDTAVIRNPYAARPWQYALHVVYGYLLLGKKLYESYSITHHYDGAYNFGPETDCIVTVKEVVDRLKQYFPEGTVIYNSEEKRIIKESKILRLDSSKAMETLCWRPICDIDEMLRLTSEFVKRQDKIGKKEIFNEYISNYLIRMSERL